MLTVATDAAGLWCRGELNVCDTRNDGSDDVIIPWTFRDRTHIARPRSQCQVG